MGGGGLRGDKALLLLQVAVVKGMNKRKQLAPCRKTNGRKPTSCSSAMGNGRPPQRWWRWLPRPRQGARACTACRLVTAVAPDCTRFAPRSMSSPSGQRWRTGGRSPLDALAPTHSIAVNHSRNKPWVGCLLGPDDADEVQRDEGQDAVHSHFMNVTDFMAQTVRDAQLLGIGQ